MNNKKRYIFTIIVIIIALGFIITGICKKEYDAYYTKAINICTQCIGIG